MPPKKKFEKALGESECRTRYDDMTTTLRGFHISQNGLNFELI